VPDIGHNGGPPLVTRNFKKRWADALFSRRDKPMGAVAMGFLLYMRMDSHGRGIVISDAEFQLYCGVSDGSCRSFKKWLLKEQFIEIVRRGYRGSCSEFLAQIPDDEIPAPIAANEHRIPAPNTDIPPPEYRHPIPVLSNGMAAPAAASAEIPANPAAVPARGLVINYNNKNNYLPTTTVEQEATRGGFGSEFESLNGSAIDLATFIAKAANVDLDVAKNMLRTNLKTYGSEAMLDAYSTTMAEMAEGMVAAPYKYLLGCAKKNKERSAGRSSAKHEQPKMSNAERIAASLARAEAKRKSESRDER
jgi:hypothetical protein